MAKVVGILKCFFRACGRRLEDALEANGTGRAYLATYGAVSLPDSLRGRG